MKIEYLKWDSTFFGKKIGRLVLSKDDDYTQLPSELSAATGYSLVYVAAHREISQSVQSRLGGTAVDCKTRFYRSLKGLEPDKSNTLIRRYKPDDYHDILRLAYASGEYSRFRIDPGFADDEFAGLYREWVNRSIDGTIADIVLVAEAEGRPAGFITYGLDDAGGTIGLVAVDQDCRGLGIGRDLMSSIWRYSIDKQVLECRVVTQADNTGAMAYYRHMGFEVEETQYIYHFWLNQGT